MKALNLFHLILAGCGLAASLGCEIPDPQNPVAYECKLNPPTRVRASANAETYADLVRDLYGYSIGQDKIRRPEWLRPDQILPRLHPWFESGKTFCLQTSEDMTIVRLAKVPKQVLQEITRLSEPNVHGIGLLNGAFWTDLRGIQDSGLDVGFLINSGAHEFAGYYSSDEKRIVFDVLANPGTPAHERRHYLQHSNALKRAEDVKKTRFTPACLTAARRFFDELDANTYQMTTWIPALSFDEKLLYSDRQDPIYFPHLELLLGYLNYPALAADWVGREDCPDSLKSVVLKLKEHAQLFQGKMVHPIGNYKGSSTVYLRDHEVDREELEQLRAKIETALATESKSRPHFIRATLFQLPIDERVTLSEVSGGFRFLIELRGY